MLPEHINDRIKMAVLQPWTGHVAAGQQVTVPIHEKGSTLGPIVISNRCSIIQPIINHNKGHRTGILIGIIYKDGLATLFLEAEVIPGQTSEQEPQQGHHNHQQGNPFFKAFNLLHWCRGRFQATLFGRFNLFIFNP